MASPVRVLLLSHTYVAPGNRGKLEALGRQPGIELVVAVPELWRDPLAEYRPSPIQEGSYRLSLLPTWGQGRVRRYLPHPWALLSLLRRERPQLLHVEAEPDSLAFLEASLLKTAVGARLIGFTWENLPRPPWAASLASFTLGRTAGILAGSQGAASMMRARGFTGPLRVLPQLGVDPERFAPAPSPALRAGLGLKGFVIGFVGRLVEAKGLGLLLRAAASLEGQFTVVFLGRGPYQPRLLSLAEELGLQQRVVVRDAIPHDAVALFLNCLDLLVLPSVSRPEWREQFGHVLVEAMACQVPVLGSNSGAIPEVAGEAGLLFQEGNEADLRDKLRYLMANPSLREELARRGRTRVLEHYTHQRIAEETVRFYREVQGPCG